MNSPELVAVANRSQEVQGMRAYVGYCTGLTLMINPLHTAVSGMLKGIHSIAENPDLVVTTAENLMYEGLKNLIRAAGEASGALTVGAKSIEPCEKRYDTVYPQAVSFVHSAFADSIQAARLQALNDSFLVVRPLPLDDAGIYASICHGRRAKIDTVRLLVNYAPNDSLARLLHRRNLGLRGKPQQRIIASRNQ